MTPQTRKVCYEVEIKQIGDDPEPFVIADARMYADGRYIVFFKDMSLKLSGTRLSDVAAFWDNIRTSKAKAVQPLICDRASLLEFALGKPSKAFGAPYAAFDTDRFIARLPNPPYLLMDRVVECEPGPWILKPDGWILSEFDVKPDHWYFAANCCNIMPYAILLEIALQPCGWLAAYMGSALKIQKDLKFRNLGGKAVLHRNIRKADTVLRTRTRLKRSSQVADMIIEEFEFIVSDPAGVVYSGETSFGFFTPEALAQQVGIRNAAARQYIPSAVEIASSHLHNLDLGPPLFPGDRETSRKVASPTGPVMPAKALLMIDAIRTFPPDSGPHNLGFMQGHKRVDPNEWFFKAHFFQDPVCPGSLGVESLIQVLKFGALKRWKALTNDLGFEMITGIEHQWTYRGQIVPDNRDVHINAAITTIQESPSPAMTADGFLSVDGRTIYEMKNYGIKLVGGHNP